MSIKVLNLALLEECFSVDFTNGVIVWKFRPTSHFISSPVAGAWNTQNSNKFASAFNREGYKIVKIGGQVFKQHRVLYGMYHNDSNPPTIDHYDGDRSNNSISNLRPASDKINNRNKARLLNNTSGITGVVLRANLKWVVRIDSDEKRISKTFEDFFEACCFRKSQEIKLMYSFRHGT